MSQQDNFLGGFLFGAAFGGVVGGVLGVLVTQRLTRQEALEGREAVPRKGDLKASPQGALKESRRPSPSPQTIDTARRGLEDKIAQLNEAIDDVRQKLGSMNGVPKPESSGVQAIADRKE